MKKITLLAVMLTSLAYTGLAQCTEDAPLPYLENFDAALPPDLPDCTYSYKQTFVGSDWDCVAAPNNGFTGNVGRYSTYSDVGWSMWCDFILRPVQLTAGMAYKVSYKYAHDDNETAIDEFRLGLFTNNLPEPIELAIHEQVSGTAIVDFSTQLFTVPETGSYYLRFSLASSGNQGILYLDDIKIEEMGVMGTSDNSLSQMSFYPNPAKDRLMITNNNGLETLQLYNMAGQLLHSQPAAGTTAVLNLETISTGIYILKATSQKAEKTIKFIKE